MLLVQIVLLWFILWRIQFRLGSARRVFSPVCWFILFYGLVFFMPQMAMPASNFPLIWTGNTVIYGNLERVLETQMVLATFLAGFTLFFSLFMGNSQQQPSELYNNLKVRINFGRGTFLIGLIATLAMYVSMAGQGPRSEIVSTTSGKALYAASFFFTLGFLLLAANSIQNRNYIRLLVLLALFAVPLFLLGGRGRVLWPLVSLLAWAVVAGYVRLNLLKVGLVVVLLFVILQAMDPVLLYLRDLRTVDTALQDFWANLSGRSLFFGRNFDAFHNVAIIVNLDRVAHDFSYIFSGSQSAFMKTYFPEVWRGGVGFPATLPGGLWMAGNWYALFGGGAIFGLIYAVLTRYYLFKLKFHTDLIAFLMFMPLVANIGTSILDSYTKIMAMVFPGLLIILLARRGPEANLAKINSEERV